MPKRFTGIRLLLIFVGINLVMIFLLVTSMTSAHPWLARVLPGHFESGGDSSGYWVFFALVLLIDALTVMIAGLAMMLPAMLEGASADERRLTRHLVDRGGVSESAKEAIFVSLREEALASHQQAAAGRAILLVGTLFLVLAFFSVSLTFARAVPNGNMFIERPMALLMAPIPLGKTSMTGVPDAAAPAAGLRLNASVHGRDVAAFTVDQVAAAVVLNAPEIYGVHFSSLVHNPDDALFTHFVFAFRTLIGFVLVLTIISVLRRIQRPKAEKKTIESVEAAAEEKS